MKGDSQMNEPVDYGFLNSQTDQRYGGRRFGRLGTIAKNGCGLIALYNIERAADDTTRFEPFYDARKQIRTHFFGLLGTNASSIVRILRKKGFEVQRIRLKKAEEAEPFDGVIVLYWFFWGAHYVAGIGNADGTYTFYNQFTSPGRMDLPALLKRVKSFRQHPFRIWGVRFPQKQDQ